jgi:hypothetical protein
MSCGGGGRLSLTGVDCGKAKVDVLGDSSGSAPVLQPIKGEASNRELVVHGSWRPEVPVDEEDVLEFNLGEETQGEIKFLAMARYY